MSKAPRRFFLICLLATVSDGSFGYGQSSPPNSGQSYTPATQVPLSGQQRQPGSVATSQSTTNTGANSVNIITSSVNVQGAYGGSVPTGIGTGTVLPLSLDYALKIALNNNLAALTESNTVRQAEAMRRIAKSALLPNVQTVVNETVEQLNLRTLGVEISSLPSVVGPFNFFDARVASLTQSVFDLVRRRNLRSAGENVTASIDAQRDARDLIVLAVAGMYLQVISTSARIAAAQAQVESSRAIYQQSSDRLNAGLDARIDVTRTQVQFQTDQQRLRSFQADLDRQKLSLSRLIGLPLGQQFSIADDFPYKELTGLTVDQALTRAFAGRADLQAAEAGKRAAEAALAAARAERYPTVGLNANYGAAGLRPTTDAHGVFTVAGTLTIPLYTGGRIGADIENAEASVRQRESERQDVRGRIDQDVRQAFIDLNEAADQVSVARSNVGLAQETLTQARDRFIAGVADTVEVVQAQQTVAQANNDYITAVYEHNLAKVALSRATGGAEQSLRQFLFGQ